MDSNDKELQAVLENHSLTRKCTYSQGSKILGYLITGLASLFAMGSVLVVEMGKRWSQSSKNELVTTAFFTLADVASLVTFGCFVVVLGADDTDALPGGNQAGQSFSKLLAIQILENAFP